MGLRPVDYYAMSLYEFNATCEGFLLKEQDDRNRYRFIAFELYKLGGGKADSPERFMPFESDIVVVYELTPDVINQVNRRANRALIKQKEDSRSKQFGLSFQNELRKKYQHA